DDALDVVAAHGVGGASGAVLTGIFATAAWGGSDGLLAGNAAQVGKQVMALAVVAAYSGAATFVLIKVVAVLLPIRNGSRAEAIGLDITEHGEEAYSQGEGTVLVLPTATPQPAVALHSALEASA
ncbi:MAG: ammonia channel protein, partial [Gemmatimonadaceae bacterium]